MRKRERASVEDREGGCGRQRGWVWKGARASVEEREASVEEREGECGRERR